MCVVHTEGAQAFVVPVVFVGVLKKNAQILKNYVKYNECLRNDKVIYIYNKYRISRFLNILNIELEYIGSLWTADFIRYIRLSDISNNPT